MRDDRRPSGRRRSRPRGELKPFEPGTITWFVPDIDSPFYGGITMVLRLADHLARTRENRFAVGSPPNELWIRSALAAAFPSLADSSVEFYDELALSTVDDLPGNRRRRGDPVAHRPRRGALPRARRRFYAIQDFEPMFYPAGSLYAVAEDLLARPLRPVQHRPPPRPLSRALWRPGHGVRAHRRPGGLFHADGRPG